MKESLAARQAALLKQNAELNERVEAIEQRRQQHQQSVHTTSTHDLRHATLSKVADDITNDDGKDPHVDDGEADGNDSAPARSVGLAMDLSASIDSLGSALAPHEPLHAARETATIGSRPQSRQHSAKALLRQGSADVEPPTSATASPATVSRGNSRRATVSGNGAGASPHAESSADSPDGLGLEATVRYQKARLRVLQDEVDTANSHVKELQASQGVLKAQIDDLKTENSVLAKKYQQTQQLLDKQKELVAAQDAKQRILESQLAAAQARADEVQRSEKQASQQFRSKDVRLNRALEELEKVKAQLQDERRAHDQDAAAKSELEQLMRENKKLEKHKSELLVAFKKQMKLIDLLKRQRIHMEAAKMLSFTEEEFSKTLELG